MSEEQVEKVFEPFSQADVSTTRKYGGTGLGLSICRKTMDAHGGQITIGTSSPQGTRFDLDFPSTMVVAQP